jgi:hypothetical protein
MNEAITRLQSDTFLGPTSDVASDAFVRAMSEDEAFSSMGDGCGGVSSRIRRAFAPMSDRSDAVSRPTNVNSARLVRSNRFESRCKYVEYCSTVQIESIDV